MPVNDSLHVGKEQKMNIKTLKTADLRPANYNPRRDLKPDDVDYQKLRRSIQELGYVEPIIWNERTGTVVGGHQRLKVLIEQGIEEIECVIVNLEEKDEKILNVLLNKAKGRWDIEKLSDILQELNEAGEMEITGYEDWEFQSLMMQYDHIKDLMNEDFSNFDPGKERDTFTMTFSLPVVEKETAEKYILNEKEAKMKLAAAVIARMEEGL